MSSLALTLVLIAALLHATWNALVKGAGDRSLTMGMIIAGHALFGLALVLAFPVPHPDSWPFIAVSVLIHWFYYGFLTVAYRHGDLSQVYPIARGVAPVLVALGAQVFAGEILPPMAWVGILLVSAGISLLMLGRKGKRPTGPAILFALLTGVTIAAYSVVDGMGVRSSGGEAFGYIGWLFLLGSPAALWFLWTRRVSPGIRIASVWAWGVAGGLTSAVAYGLAIYAKQLATLGSVSAVRESSVIIAALIGVVWFGERPWISRLAAAVIVAIGVITLAVAH